MWKTVKASTRKVGMGETERRRGKGRKREGKEEKTQKENGRSKKSSRRVEDMG